MFTALVVATIAIAICSAGWRSDRLAQLRRSDVRHAPEGWWF